MNKKKSHLDHDRDKESQFRYVGLASEIKPGTGKSFSIVVNGSEESDNMNKKRNTLEVAVFNLRGRFHAISNSCIHKGGPLSQGFLNGEIVTCPWHGWKYSVRDGKSPHKGGDSVNSYKVKVVDGEKLYVSYLPCDIGHRVTQPHQAYSKLAQSVDKYLRDAAKDVGSLRSSDRINDKRIEGETLKRRGTRTNARTTRVLGISTTNANDNIAPRKSTSEEALSFALNHAKNDLHTAETVMIKLGDLEFKHCEGYYSKNAKACIFPCSISEMDK
jgi:nitrite reductase/ring-hydroxylating ferredoxin subunit